MVFLDTDTITTARAKYYQMNGLPPDGGSYDKWARYKLGAMELIAFPNFQHRVKALARHDIHHIVNDIDTSPLGEGLIGAWEMGTGCGPYWISWAMESQAMFSGIAMAPRQTFAMFIKGRRSSSFYQLPLSDDIGTKSVGELRAKLLPPENLAMSATIMDWGLFLAAGILGALMLLLFIPIFIVFGILGKTVL